MTRGVLLAGMLVLAGLVPGGGCASDPTVGYAFDADYDRSVRTVSVSVFENRTFIHGIEDDLTESIIREIHRSTPWKVELGEGADTALTGAVTAVRNRKVSTQQQSGLVQEMAVEMTVSFEWKDRTTGEILVSRRRFSSLETFVPTPEVGERLEMGQRAVVQEMAERIVRELRASW